MLLQSCIVLTNNQTTFSKFTFSQLLNPLFTHIQNTIKASSQPYNKINKVYILGNTSCDLDSFLSSYLLSFPKNFLKSNLNSTSPLYIPLINCRRHELSHRFEIDYLCKKYNINTSNFAYFPDKQIQQDLLTNNNAKVILVDHNKPDMSQLKLLNNHVMGVYDHHRDENYSFKGDKYLKYPLGSCTTLILRKYYLKNPKLFKYVDPLLSVSSILLDTENFDANLYNKKWIKEDKDVFNEIIYNNSRYTKEHVESFYKKLIQIKYDKRANLNIGVQGILMKDKKSFIWNKHHTNKTLTAGWSTLPVSYKEIITRYGVNAFFDVIMNMCKKYKYDFYVCNYSDIYHNNQSTKGDIKVKSFIIFNYHMSNIDFELMIKGIYSLLGIHCYKKEKIEFNIKTGKSFHRFYAHQSISRKHFEPIIREYFNSYKYKH